MISKDELNDKMKVLLSNEDFGKYIQHLDKKVVKFSDLENYKDIYQLLPECEDYRITLIEKKHEWGTGFV